MGDVYYKSFVTFFAHSYAQEPSNDSDMSQTPKNGSKHTGSNDDVNTKDQSAEDGGSGFLETHSAWSRIVRFFLAQHFLHLEEKGFLYTPEEAASSKRISKTAG